jgi:hypothetical protein
MLELGRIYKKRLDRGDASMAKSTPLDFEKTTE